MSLMESLNSAISDSDQKNQGSSPRSPWIRLLIVVIVIIFAWVITPWLNYYFVAYFGDENTDKLGQFGDIFGSINSLFSGLGLIFVSITLWSQGEESKKERVAVEKSIKATESLGGAILFSAIIGAKITQLAQYYAQNRTKPTLDKMDKMLERTTQMLKEFGLPEDVIKKINIEILESPRTEDSDDVHSS